MGWSVISASYTTQTGSYQSQVATGVNTGLNISEGTITAGSNWSAISDGHAFAVVRAGAIICVRCAKSVSTTTLTYYRLYFTDLTTGLITEEVTDVRVGDTIVLYERDNTVGSGTALGSVVGITLSTYGTSLYDLNIGNNGLLISGYYQVSALARAGFGLTSPINQVDQGANGHLALGQYRTANGVTVRSSRTVFHNARNNSNQPFIRTSSTSRTDWFGGTIFPHTGTIATTSGGYGLKIYGPECVLAGASGLSQIRVSSANDFIYGVTLDLGGYVPLNVSAVANGVVCKNCDQAFGLSSVSPIGFIQFSGWNFTGAGNNVDISFWTSKWSWCRNSSVGSALTCQGNSTGSTANNRGLTKITQDVALSITDPAGTGLAARFFCRDTNNGNRLAANQIGSNPSYLSDLTYEGTTTVGVGSISDVVLRVTWQNIANVAVDRYTGLGDDYRGLDNSSTDRFRFALACYGYEPVTTVQVLKGVTAKSVAYTLLADAGVTAAKATAATYTDRFSIDASGNVTVTANATLDQLYDYAQAWLEASGTNMESAGLGNKLVSWSGSALTATKNLTINGGATLSSGAKFSTITISGTLTITGAMDVVSYTSPAGTFVKLSYTNAQVSLTGTTWLYIRNITDGADILSQAIAAADGYTYVQYTAAKSLRARCLFVDGADANTEFEQFQTLTANGVTFDIRGGSDDLVYISNAIDGQAVLATGEFTADGPNLECDVDDPDNATVIQRIYAWYKAYLATDAGIKLFWGAMTAKDTANIVVNRSIVPLKFDNKQSVLLKIGGGLIINDDGSTDLVAASTTGSIFFHSGNAPSVQVMAQVEASTVLAKQATSLAIKAKTDNLPSDPADQSLVEAAISAIPPAPSAPTVASAVRVELATELARIDAATTTRLAAAAYTAPPTSAATAAAVWDEVLTGATHNVPSSAGRRLRQTTASIIIDGTARGAGTSNNQIQLGTDASPTNGAYDPSMVYIVSGAGAGQCRIVLQYDGANRIATVHRSWRTLPNATSEYVIVAYGDTNSVNEGLAQGGSPTSITLNADASSTNGTYVGQLVFLVSGVGEDQCGMVTAYDGATKVATIDMGAGGGWSVTPDTTTAYVMMPASPVIVSSASVCATQIAAIKAKTDNLPSDPADNSDILSAISSKPVGATASEVWGAATRTLTAGTKDTQIDAIKAKTDNLPASPAAASDIPSAATNAAAVRADLTTELARLDVEVSTRLAGGAYVPTNPPAIADAILGRNLAGGQDGGRTVRDALRPARNRVEINDTTITVYREDDTTPAWTAQITTAARDAIQSVDPA